MKYSRSPFRSLGLLQPGEAEFTGYIDPPPLKEGEEPRDVPIAEFFGRAVACGQEPLDWDKKGCGYIGYDWIIRNESVWYRAICRRCLAECIFAIETPEGLRPKGVRLV